MTLADAPSADTGTQSRLSATVQRIVGLTEPISPYTEFHDRFLQESVAAIREQSLGQALIPMILYPMLRDYSSLAELEISSSLLMDSQFAPFSCRSFVRSINV